MAGKIPNDKKWIVDIRMSILQKLFKEGYTDADIARVMFNTHRATIGRMRKNNDATLLEGDER